MRKILFIAGISLLTIAVFAQQIGIDNDEGWGRKRIIILMTGLAFILVGLLIFAFQSKLAKLENYLTKFKNENLSYSRAAQFAFFSCAAAIIVFIIYVWLTQPIIKDSRGNYNYYSELAGGFKNGHLYLDEKPSPALLALSNPYDYFLRKEQNVEDFPWDVSLYNNRFYTYWGPAPSLILTIFTDSQLSRIGDHHLSLAFAYGLFLYTLLIIANFWQKSLQNAPAWMFGVLMLTIGLSAPVTIMLRDSRIYEAAIFGSQFFFIGGCYWAYSAINNNKFSVWKLAFASIHWAFALGTRVTILPAVFFSVLVTITYIFIALKPIVPKTFISMLAIMGIPLLLALCGMGWYNWARFESIFEFGLKYQLTNVDYSVFRNSFSVQYMARNLYNYFAYPLTALPKFPYISRTEFLASNDRLAGLIFISPYIFLLFTPLIRVFANPQPVKNLFTARRIQVNPQNWLSFVFAGSTLIATIIILSFYFVTMRYMEDFMPSLLLLTTILIGQEYLFLSRNAIARKTLTFIIIVTASITITASILVAIPKSEAVFMINLINSISKTLGLK